MNALARNSVSACFLLVPKGGFCTTTSVVREKSLMLPAMISDFPWKSSIDRFFTRISRAFLSLSTK